MERVTTIERDQPGFDWKVAGCVGLLVVLAVGPFIHHMGEQQASRYAFTAAIWDQSTLVLSDYTDMLGRDLAIKDGVVYSDKAPGQPFLAVPFLAIYRLFDGDTSTPGSVDPEPAVWWLTFWTATIPAAVLAMLMYSWAKEVERSTALAATLTMLFGTLLVVYATLLFGHVLAATLAFAMFLLIREKSVSPGGLYLGGLLGGLAVLVEYPVALVVLLLTGAAFYLHRASAWRVLVGGVPSVLLMGWYNLAAFGSPLSFSYQFSGFLEEPRATTAIFPGPSWQLLLEVLYSPRGLLVAAPVLVMALLGLYRMWSGRWRFDAVVAGSVFLAMLMVQASWSNPYAGGAGPRYVTPALPFLVAPLAVAWKRWRISTVVLSALSIATLGAATLTNPQLGTEFRAGARYWFGELVSGNLAPMMWSWSLGWAGWLIHLVSVAGAAFLLWRISGGRNFYSMGTEHEKPRPRLSEVAP